MARHVAWPWLKNQRRRGKKYPFPFIKSMGKPAGKKAERKGRSVR